MRNYEIFLEIRKSSAEKQKRLYGLAEKVPVADKKEVWKDIANDFKELLSERLEKQEKWHANKKISVLTIIEQNYPDSLYPLHRPPLVLFCLDNHFGSRPIPEQENSIAIVGSRAADAEGVSIARWFAKELASNGATIVSGLAFGADAAAHWGSLAADPAPQIPTIAVLGSGVCDITPRSHERLANRILNAGGYIISEYEPFAAAHKFHYLERNRIIAALSRAVLVVQAGKRSGALSTARRALELGREVFVIPGSITNPLYAGSNQLIQEGATPVVTPQGLMAELGFTSDYNSAKNPSAELLLKNNLKSQIMAYLATYGSIKIKEAKIRFSKEGVSDTDIDILLEELFATEEIRPLSNGKIGL